MNIDKKYDISSEKPLQKRKELVQYDLYFYCLWYVMIQKLMYEFAELIAPSLWVSVNEVVWDIVIAPDNVKGDFAFPCFKRAKTLWKNPVEISKDIVNKIQTSDSFSEIISVGPYVNAVLNHDSFGKNIIEKVEKEKEDFWRGESTWKQFLLEWWQPNTHKAIHIWHIRNILVSESNARILKYAWNDVVKCCYPWDIGAHVAKWIWYYTKFYEWEMPKENFSKWVWTLYSDATKKVDENPDVYKPEVWDLQKRLEDWDEDLVKIWKETRELCLQDMKKIFAELWSEEIDRRYFESEVEKPWIELVRKLQAEWKAVISEWALAINLEEYGLWRFLLLKSNWASLYSTKDIWLAFRKQADYPNYSKSLYVVWSEQEHHFAQLFKTLEIMWIDRKKLQHISYGLVDLKEWKMSSRAWNVILYEDFRDQLIEKAELMVADRYIPAEEKKQTARKIAFWAMKFGMLLQDSEKKIIFDLQTALSFEGETWPYLQYTTARMASILRKNTLDISWHADYTLLNSDEEKAILLKLAWFEEEVQKAANEYKPNYIARWCLDIAQLFNSYYHNHKIIDEANVELSRARLHMLQAILQVMKNALNLLGIDAVESM